MSERFDEIGKPKRKLSLKGLLRVLFSKEQATQPEDTIVFVEPEESIRVTVNLPSSMVQTLQEMAEQNGTTVTQEIQSAIDFGIFDRSERDKGSRILILKRTGNIYEVVSGTKVPFSREKFYGEIGDLLRDQENPDTRRDVPDDENT